MHATGAVRRALLTDETLHQTGNLYITLRNVSYLNLAPAEDTFPVRSVIHVCATVLVVIIFLGRCPPLFFIHHLSYLLLPHGSIIGSGGGWLLSFQPSALAWLVHIAVSAVWISPPPHTPLNASLLLQHIIFADHKIHPQRFPGRT